MTKLQYTKSQIEDIKSKIYLTKDEEQILDMWLHEKSLIEMSLKLNMSTASISRRKKIILEKISRVI